MAYQELYNYTGKNAVKMAGTLTQFSIDGGTTWLDLQGFQEIGTVGTKANTIDSLLLKIRQNDLFPVSKKVRIKSWRCYGMTVTHRKKL
jgi:hypothetical protein